MERGLLSSSADCKCLCFCPITFYFWCLAALSLSLGTQSTASRSCSHCRSWKVYKSYFNQSHRSFWQIGSKLKISGPLGKFTTVLVILERYHEMLPHSRFCHFTFSLCWVGGCTVCWRVNKMYVIGFCPCRTSNLDYCDNCMELIRGGPLHREPWSSEKQVDVLTVDGNMAPGQGLRGEHAL